MTPESYFKEASKAAQAITWLHQLKFEIEQESDSSIDKDSLCIVERLENLFNKIGTRNPFEIDKKIKAVRDGIIIDESIVFEKAQVSLGLLVGYDAGKREEDSSPDPWWLVNERLGFVFEDYTGGKETSAVSTTKARQASTHEVWLKEYLPIDKDATIYTFLVGKIHRCIPSAIPHLRNVGFLTTEEFRALTNRALLTIRSLWDSYRGPGDMFWKIDAIDQLDKAGILPKNLITLFNENNAAKRLGEV